MNVDDLKIALLVAELGSFAAVSRRLDVDPSSISRSVASLEAKTGIRLFHRSTRHLSLTDAGARYLDRIRPAIAALEAARDEAQSARAKPSGLVRMTASVAFGQACVVPLLPKLRLQHPEIALDLMLSDETLDLVGQGLDLAIRLAPAPEGDLISARLRRTRYILCASPDYLASAPPLSSPDDLKAHACLRYALPGLRDVWRFKAKDGAVTEVAITGPYAVTNAMALMQAACLGLGPALLADWLVEDAIEDGQLVALLPGCAATPTTFDTGAWLLYPSRQHLPQRVRAVIDFLRQELTKRS